MAILNFPASPALDQTYIVNNVIYTWNGEYWEANTNSGFDSRYVEVDGDNMTGDLTLGTDNITLDAAAGNITAAGYGLFYDDIISSIANEFQHYIGRKSDKSLNGLSLFIASSSDGALNPTMFECKTRPGGVDAVVASIKADGSAEFAGNVDIGGAVTNGAGITLRPAGLMSIRADRLNGDAFSIFTNGNLKANHKFLISLDGSIRAGGVIPEDPNIAINATDGSAEFKGTVRPNKLNVTDYAVVNGAFTVNRASGVGGNANLYAGQVGSVNKIVFYTDGRAIFTGSVTQNGTITRSVNINLEADDPTKYTTDIDDDGNEIQRYIGPTLDVKDRLTKVDAALTTLKSAAAAASDFTTLKSAIATALANI